MQNDHVVFITGISRQVKKKVCVCVCKLCIAIGAYISENHCQ
jgi:hypothetical protein